MSVIEQKRKSARHEKGTNEKKKILTIFRSLRKISYFIQLTVNKIYQIMRPTFEFTT